MERECWTYIVASRAGTPYIGVTNNIERRIWQHKTSQFEGFASKHHCDRLVYCENFTNAPSASAREKQIQGWRRSKKIALIESRNPRWEDLAEKWGSQMALPGGRSKQGERAWIGRRPPIGYRVLRLRSADASLRSG